MPKANPRLDFPNSAGPGDARCIAVHRRDACPALACPAAVLAVIYDKNNVDAEHARQLEIAHKLLSDVFDVRTTLVRVSGEMSDQLEQITVATLEEVENQLSQWDSQEHSKFVQEAEKLFNRISTRLGPVVAKEILKLQLPSAAEVASIAESLTEPWVFTSQKQTAPPVCATRNRARS
jgi:hypothetical protein